MQWIDYLFTEEGALLANYGIEGETYEYNEEGIPVFIEKIANNPDGLSVSQAMATYTLVPSKLPSHYDWTFIIGILDVNGADWCPQYLSGRHDLPAVFHILLSCNQNAREIY